MDEPLKQRLIGIGIVVVFAILFVPLLFDKSPDKSREPALGAMPPMPQELRDKPIPLPGNVADTSKSVESGEPGKKAGKAGSSYKIIPILDEPVAQDNSTADRGVPLAAETSGTTKSSPPVSGPGISGTTNVLPGKRAPIANSQVIADEEMDEDLNTASQPSVTSVRQPTRDTPVTQVTPGPKAPTPVRAVKPNRPPVPNTAETSNLPTVNPKPTVQSPPRKTESVGISNPPNGKSGSTVRKNTAEASAAQPLWVVQLGSFNSEANARDLVEKLRLAHFSAHIETMTTASGTIMYRVQTAPEIDRHRADESLKKMESSSGVHGIVLPHP